MAAPRLRPSQPRRRRSAGLSTQIGSTRDRRWKRSPWRRATSPAPKSRPARGRRRRHRRGLDARREGVLRRLVQRRSRAPPGSNRFHGCFPQMFSRPDRLRLGPARRPTRAESRAPAGGEPRALAVRIHRQRGGGASSAIDGVAPSAHEISAARRIGASFCRAASSSSSSSSSSSPVIVVVFIVGKSRGESAPRPRGSPTTRTADSAPAAAAPPAASAPSAPASSEFSPNRLSSLRLSRSRSRPGRVWTVARRRRNAAAAASRLRSPPTDEGLAAVALIVRHCVRRFCLVDFRRVGLLQVRRRPPATLLPLQSPFWKPRATTRRPFHRHRRRRWIFRRARRVVVVAPVNLRPADFARASTEVGPSHPPDPP